MEGDGFRLLLTVLIEGAVVIGLAYCLMAFLRRFPAAVRYRVIAAAVCGLSLMPFANVLLPAWKLPLLPSNMLTSAENSPAQGNPPPALLPGNDPAANAVAPGTSGRNSASGMPESGQRLPTLPGYILEVWPTLPILLWVAGALAVLLVQIVRWAGIGFIAGMSLAEADRGKLDLLERMRRSLRIGRKVTLLRSEIAPVAMTCGQLNPCLILPGESSAWADEQTEAVLRHELAHIKRHDNLVHLVSVLACAVHWFNPLVWMLVRRLNLEREVACDDTVLAGGTKPSTYAKHLVEITKRLSGPKSHRLVPVMMAHSSDIKKRLLAILDTEKDHKNPGVASTLWLSALMFAASLTVAAIHPWGETSNSVPLPLEVPFPRQSIIAGQPALPKSVHLADKAHEFLYRYRDYAKAAVMFEKIGRKYPLYVPAWLERGRALEALGDYDGAVRAFAVLRLVRPRSGLASFAAFSIARCCFKQGDEERGLHWLGRAFLEGFEYEGQLLDDPDLAGMHNRTAFKRLIEAAGTAEMKAVMSEYIKPVYDDGLPSLPAQTATNDELDLLATVATESRDAALRKKAVRWLGYDGSPGAVVVIRRVLSLEQDAEVLEEAASALVANPDPGVTARAAAELANHPGPIVRLAAARGLHSKAPETALRILEALAFADTDGEKQLKAIRLMDDLPGGLGLPALRRVLTEHPSERVRAEARRILEASPVKTNAGG